MKQKLKRWMAAGLAGMMISVFASCGEKAIVLDPAVVADTVLEQVTFDSELEPASEIVAQLMYVLPEGAEIALYAGSGSYADEFAIITCASEADVAAAKEAAQLHLDEVKSSFAAYIPEESSKAEDAIIKTVGKYVIVCVTDDANAASVIDAAVK